MKRILFLFIILCFNQLLLSQETIIEEIREDENIPEEDQEIGFSYMENPPIYPSCESLESKKQKDCFRQKIAKHIEKNFNFSFKDSLGLTSGEKNIFVMLTINKDGLIRSVKGITSRQRMAREAERVLRLLPRMKPGKQNDMLVNVYYYFNIPFSIK